MALIRRFLILSHRYLGIALSLLVAVWFASGFVMMYAGGMPRVDPELRLERLGALDMSRVRLTLAEAAEKAGFDPADGWSGPRVTALSVMNRPAYRFGNAPTVFADDGSVLSEVSRDQAKTIAAAFLRVPESKLLYARTLTEPDQWTLGQGRRMPQYKFVSDDGEGTEIYVQAGTGDVTMLTDGRSRLLAWLGTIPHWLYFAPLRVNQPLWYGIVVWTSAITCLLAVAGLAVAIFKLRRPRPFRWSLAIPYTGWMRWHFVTGLIFGISTLTFAFSGLLSMEPFAWTRAKGFEVRSEVLAGGPLDFTQFPAHDLAAWKNITDGRAIKEIEFTRIQGQPFYVVRQDPDSAATPAPRERLHQPYNVSGRQETDRLLVAANSLQIRDEPFSADTIISRIKAAYPDVPILEQQMLSDYDSYYYSRGRVRPLPVLRLKLGDPMQTWVYIDPRMSQVLAHVHRLNRVERWLYNGLHSLDFSFLYGQRPLWDIVMMTLLAGGLASSTLGLYLGLRRVRRGTVKVFASARGAIRMRSEPAE